MTVIFGVARLIVAAFAARPLISQLWVKIGLDDLETGLPKYPGKLTFTARVGRSQTCQERK
jgi:hypothetical protein